MSMVSLVFRCWLAGWLLLACSPLAIARPSVGRAGVRPRPQPAPASLARPGFGTFPQSAAGSRAISPAAIETAADAIRLESDRAGAMVGTVASLGPDAFEFSLPGAPAGVPPLRFERRRP